MVKVKVQPDCGNAPKKAFIRDFMIAFANHDMAFILSSLDDEAEWHVLGKEVLQGDDAVENALNYLLKSPVKEMTLETIITHGADGSVNGSMTLSDGDLFGFCHVFSFKSAGKQAKVKQIASYVIATK